MAEGIRVSRLKGLTFGNITISNSDKSGIFLLRVEKPSTPSLNTFELTAPGRDGSVFLKDRYMVKDITVTIAIYKENLDERRSEQRRITAGLVHKEDKLYFHDEPDKYHIGEVFDEVKVVEQEYFTELSFTFKCKPFIFSDNSNTSWTGITSRVTKQIDNKGNHESKPLVKVKGTATRVSVTFRDKAFSLANVTGEIFVDCENMNVYTIHEDKKKSVLSTFSGTFPSIPVGRSEVTIDGEALNLQVDVIFTNTYIC